MDIRRRTEAITGFTFGSAGTDALTTAQLASHSHTSHISPITFSSHGQQPNPFTAFTATTTGSSNDIIRSSPTTNNAVQNQGSGTGHNHSHTLTGTLTGNITTTLTGSVNAAGTNSFSPFVIVTYIIKH